MLWAVWGPWAPGLLGEALLLQASPKVPPYSPLPAPGIALLWGKARPGTEPVQLVPLPCGVCPQPESREGALSGW